jgi:multiple sugar transport system permease protein
MMDRTWNVIFVLVAGLVVVARLFPFLWFVATSLKTQMEVTAIPPVLLPSWSLDFYRSALWDYNILHFLKNSLIVAGMATLGTLSISVFAGYALARLPIRHKPLIMGSLLLVSMFPQISIAGPVWKILDSLGWLNTYQGLILPYITLTLPLGVWIMAGFFRELPQELEDSARVDGCGHFQTLFRIIIPLAAPGVWGEIAAASTIATIPLVLMVLLFQRRIVRGLSAGAIKG